MGKEKRVEELIAAWIDYRKDTHKSDLYCQLSRDLYQVRNAGWQGNPPISVWPKHLVDSDDETMASVEHYFLSRCWVGSGKMPAWELKLLKGVYKLGKYLGVTPKHNPNKPTTPPSDLQTGFQDKGISDGEGDLKKSGKEAPGVVAPPVYY